MGGGYSVSAIYTKAQALGMAKPRLTVLPGVTKTPDGSEGAPTWWATLEDDLDGDAPRFEVCGPSASDAYMELCKTVQQRCVDRGAEAARAAQALKDAVALG